MADAPLFYSILFDTHLALTGCGSSTVHARGPDGSDRYSDAYDRSLRTGGRASRRKPRLALHLGRESETQRG